MATGYEVKMYQDITSIARSLAIIADAVKDTGTLGTLGSTLDALVERLAPASDDLLGVARASGVLVGEGAEVVTLDRKEPPY